MRSPVLRQPVPGPAVRRIAAGAAAAVALHSSKRPPQRYNNDAPCRFDRPTSASLYHYNVARSVSNVDCPSTVPPQSRLAPGFMV
ncbi:hypothetical protein B0G80_8702 [Paraburkholderia sp. BL6669N2]|nr:hypothetical protein B0G80_8702 [Paraburkholderia sp. BL6669N2]